MNPHEKQIKQLLEQERKTRQVMLGMLEDIQEQKERTMQIHKEWMDAFDTIDDGILLHDDAMHIMRCNNAYRQLAKAKKFKDIIGQPYWKVFPKLQAPMHSCSESITSGKVAIEEFQLEDGRIFKSRTYPIYNNDDVYQYGIHIFEDITELRQQELQITRLNKTLSLISHCNELLVRSTTEDELISNVCQEIVLDDEYDFAGVFFQHDHTITCDSYSYVLEHLSTIKGIDLSNQQYADCPITIALKEQRAICINDIAHDPQWHDILVKHKEICPAAAFDMQGSILYLPLSKEDVHGVLAIYTREIHSFDTKKSELFEELSSDVSYGVHTLRLRYQYQQLSQERERMFHELSAALDGTVHAVAMMVEARDPYTAGHQNRVSKLAVAIAQKLNLDAHRLKGLELASMVHDIGKIQIPAELLVKPTSLTDIEYQMIQTHPQTGYDILKNIKFPWPIADIIHQHHEHINGSGYPKGLQDHEILLEAKILVVADVVEAMASHRPYRASLGVTYALEEIQRYRGVYYAPDVVDSCVQLIQDESFNFNEPHSYTPL